MSIFTAENLRKTYGRGKNLVTELDNVSLSLDSGRIYGLVGNNGAGKTTLMRLMAGFTTPTSGSMTLFGASEERGLREARKRMGVLVAEPSGYEDLTLRQNLAAQSILIPANARADLTELCRLVGLSDETLGRTLRKCSTGEKQRYGIASALLGKPELLVLDEPMNGLDPGGVTEIRELLLYLNRERGMTILVSSHLLTELHRIATDYIFFRYGKILETVTAMELGRRMAEQNLKDVESYFLELNRAAGQKEGSFYLKDGNT